MGRSASLIDWWVSVEVAQPELLDFASRILWKFAEVDATRRLETRDPCADMLDELRLGDQPSGCESHECGDDLSLLFVG